MQLDLELLNEIDDVRSKIEDSVVGPPLLQVDPVTSEVTVWFPTRRGTFATYVADANHTHEVPKDYFGYPED